jgi:Na+/H+-dicarboxylate symporter
MNGKKNLTYLLAISLGIICGLSNIPFLQTSGAIVADVFVRLFKCLSSPVLALSLIVTIATHDGKGMGAMWRKTLSYTLSTTFIAALISMGLYLLIQPDELALVSSPTTKVLSNESYLHYLGQLIPSNIFKPFVDNQVMSILLIALVIGFATRKIPDDSAKQTLMSFFKGLYSMLFVIIKWVVAILPLGLFGFISVALSQIKSGANFQALSQYLLVIVLANLVQGFIVLPLLLRSKGITPFKAMKGMLPALSVAFFSKSSTGTLPLTIETAEKNLKVKPEVSRFVLPLCTSLNMNGCAAFIFATVIFVMQSNGFHLSIGAMLGWTVIATIAAVGNAGVPMGCFFLSASLLSSMNVPIVLLGLILPFYNIIDMIETALNVWSDSCVANIISQEEDRLPQPYPDSQELRG